jgi:hypothetical protein
MNKRNLQNEELDRLGRKLLDATRARTEEIEQIVGSPMLFDAVKSRIENQRRERNSKNVFAGWAIFQIWYGQTVAAAVLFLFIAGVIGLIGISKFDQQQPFEQALVPEIQPEIKRFEISRPPAPVLKDSPVIVKTSYSESASLKTEKQKVFTDKTLKAQKSLIRKPNRQPRFQPKQNESLGEFYALTFAGNPGEAGQEMQIVRAELSRSSLFALGVNLPIENESPKIKTDLLVGADGVARAIRIVD